MMIIMIKLRIEDKLIIKMEVQKISMHYGREWNKMMIVGIVLVLIVLNSS